jgi:hypothetical protein
LTSGESANSRPGLRLAGPGILTGMPMVRFPRLGPRGVLGFVMGIAAIFDLTGATVYRTMRAAIPPAPPPQDGNDPFRAAMHTITSSCQDAMAASRNENGAALPA